MALINEYSPGAPIAAHRDAPQYDIVAGVSLLSSCRMSFAATSRRPRPPRHRAADRDARDHHWSVDRRT
jgi:alkylated DNA repair dioxygenase AlkB